MTLRDLPRAEVRSWLSDHAFTIAQARADFEAATERYASILAHCEGAFENARTDAKRFTDSVMDTADGSLAEEVRLEIGI